MFEILFTQNFQAQTSYSQIFDQHSLELPKNEKKLQTRFFNIFEFKIYPFIYSFVVVFS